MNNLINFVAQIKNSKNTRDDRNDPDLVQINKGYHTLPMRKELQRDFNCNIMSVCLSVVLRCIGSK